MSYFRSADILRELAAQLRRHNVSQDKIEATKAALCIFSPDAIDALRGEWVALALDDLAMQLSRVGRAEKTPPPTQK